MNERELLSKIASIAQRGVLVAEQHNFTPDDRLAEIAELTREFTRVNAGKPSDRDVLLDAADALREAGNTLFHEPTAPPKSTRRAWNAEDRLREHFGLPDPDAAPATSAPEKKE